MCGYPTRTNAFDTARPTVPPDGLSPDDFPDLKDAFMAWKAGAYEDMVQESLKVLGITTRSPNAPQGLIGWTVTVDSAALYVSFDRARSEIVAEAPVVWVPEHQRVSLMRALLELNLWALEVARFCLHGDVVVLRFADRVENVSPPKLVTAVREVGREADRHDNWLAEKFGARMVGPEAQRARFDWSFLGKSVDLHGFEQVTAPPPPKNPPSPVASLMALLESAMGLVATHAPSRDGPIARMISRAAIFRAWSEHRRTTPAAATLVLDGGWPVILAPFGQEQSVPQVLAWIDRLRTLSDELYGLAPAPAPPVPELDIDVRQYASNILALLERLPPDPMLRMFVMLGGIGEVLVRAPIGTEPANRLTYAVQWAQQVPTTPESCQQIANVIRGLMQ